MTVYHHLVAIKLGCGCQLENRIELQDDVEPDGMSAYLALMVSLNDPDIFGPITDHDHQEKGNEIIDIKVRTKVGDIDDTRPTWEDEDAED